MGRAKPWRILRPDNTPNSHMGQAKKIRINFTRKKSGLKLNGKLRVAAKTARTRGRHYTFLMVIVMLRVAMVVVMREDDGGGGEI